MCRGFIAEDCRQGLEPQNYETSQNTSYYRTETLSNVPALLYFYNWKPISDIFNNVNRSQKLSTFNLLPSEINQPYLNQNRIPDPESTRTPRNQSSKNFRNPVHLPKTKSAGSSYRLYREKDKFSDLSDEYVMNSHYGTIHSRRAPVKLERSPSFNFTVMGPQSVRESKQTVISLGTKFSSSITDICDLEFDFRKLIASSRTAGER